MIIRNLNFSDRAAAQAMWQEIFEEEPAFTAYYFKNRFYPEYSFGAFDNDLLVAMTLGRPTAIRVEGRDISSLLVAGVSTMPDYRGRGLMHTLMMRLIDHAKRSEFECCYLHPVSESLYTSLGFRNGTDMLRITSDGQQSDKNYDIREGETFIDLLSVYNRAMLTHDGMQLRNIDEFRTIFADYATDRTKTLIAYDDKRPIGYICFSESGSVYELLADKPDGYKALLREADKQVGKTIKALAPVDCGIGGERLYSMQYLVFNNAFQLPLKNGYCRLAY